MLTLHIAINGETKGPYTPEQIFSMWSSGGIPADSLYFNEETQAWEPLLDVIGTFKPATGLKKILNIQEPTEEHKKQGDATVNKGCGCLSIVTALILLFVGYGMFQYSFTDSITETEYKKELNSNPEPVFRDPYKIYSPEEERAYQQKKLDAQYKTVTEKKTRAKDASEVSTEKTTGIVSLIIGVIMLVVGFRYYSKSKT